MKYVLVSIKTLIGLVFLLAGSGARAEPAPIYLGSVAMDIPAVMHKRLTPLTQYLSETLKQPVVLKLSPNMAAAIDEVVAGDVDITYLTPVAYLEAHARNGARLMVKTMTQDAGFFKLMIVVRDDSPIQTVADLSGKRFALDDKAALLQRAVVVGAGMPLEKLGVYDFLGHYDNIVRSVMHHDYDAGILKDTTAYKWQDKGIRILYSSPELPPYNITARNNLDDRLFARLQQAFLKLDISNPHHKPVIEALSPSYTGFTRTSDAEYEIVRKLVKPFK